MAADCIHIDQRNQRGAATVRVLFAGTSYPRSDADWQGIFIKRIADALAERNDTGLRVWAPPGPLHAAAVDARTDGDTRFLGSLQEAGGIAHLLRNAPLRGGLRAAELLLRLRAAIRRNADWAQVLHLNWLQCVLGAAGSRQPVLATVLGSDLALLEKPWVRRAVRRAIASRPLAICPNADWMVPVIRRHLDLPEGVVRCVPFGLDPAWFAVERRPADAPRIWITVLRLTRRKIGPLFEWTRGLDPATDEFHLFGPLQEDIPVPGWIRYHGPVTPRELASDWYPRATGMITLSEHDEGLPQVLLEAMAAGVPVVCSRLRAHEELCGVDGERGTLVSSADGFRAALARVPQGTAAAAASRARAHVQREYGTWQDCAGRYRAIHADLLHGTTP